ncbi:MAG: ribulose-phosphate 3-epimerase [Candidatus Woesearchaeota archaeon]
MSILDANFGNLQAEVDKVANADFLHFDIMDGHFVPNLSFGPQVVKEIQTKLPKVVHLMISNPEDHWEKFANAGASMIIMHLESSHELEETITKIKNKKIKVGLAVSPQTQLHWLPFYLDKVDQILLMTVQPGVGGQKFLYEILPKIDELRQMTSLSIAVDGGINAETGKLCMLAGADILGGGSFIFKSKDPTKQVEILKKI